VRFYPGLAARSSDGSGVIFVQTWPPGSHRPRIALGWLLNYSSHQRCAGRASLAGAAAAWPPQAGSARLFGLLWLGRLSSPGTRAGGPHGAGRAGSVDPERCAGGGFGCPDPGRVLGEEDHIEVGVEIGAKKTGQENELGQGCWEEIDIQ